MPGMSGKNLFESIIVNYPQVKVLYMSGYTRDEIEQRGVMEKGGYFIQKPFSMKSLLNKVREVLGR
jgi:DNA-binding response OmpR family regulator